ncbi:MAG: AI-2E family transporter [Balneolaceae bacterium]
MENDYPWYVKYTFGLAALILTIYVMIVGKALLVPVLFSLFFSIMLTPLCDGLERFKIPRFLAALLAILIALLFMAGIGFFLYTQLTAFVADASEFERRLSELFEDLEGFLVTWFGMENVIRLDTIDQTLFDFIRDNAGELTRRLAGMASILTAIFLVPVFVFLLLLFRDFLKEFVLQAFGRKSDEALQRIRRIVERISSVVFFYINGILIVIFILAVINSVVLLSIGVEHAIFFGVFAAMLNVIPFVGPILGSFLPALYALLMMDSLLYPLIILASFYVIQLFESNLFTPVIVGGQIRMNALVTLLLLFIGAQIWGLVGMILFIPLGAVLKVVFDEFEAMKPLGFLLGSVPSKMRKERGPLARRIGQLSRRKDEESDSDRDESNGNPGTPE